MILPQNRDHAILTLKIFFQLHQIQSDHREISGPCAASIRFQKLIAKNPHPIARPPRITVAAIPVGLPIGCVFASGRAVDLCMDHHRWAPYENLFTDIDAGEGTRLFSSSGGGNRGLHTAAGATFWNIRCKRPTQWPSNLGIEAINVVALPTNPPSVLEPNGRWLEAIAPDQVQPANLYQAMLQRRLRDRTD